MANYEFVNFVRYVWNIIITNENADYVLNKYPDILSNYTLQKTILGKNDYDFRTGHKSPIYITII